MGYARPLCRVTYWELGKDWAATGQWAGTDLVNNPTVGKHRGGVDAYKKNIGLILRLLDMAHVFGALVFSSFRCAASPGGRRPKIRRELQTTLQNGYFPEFLKCQCTFAVTSHKFPSLKYIGINTLYQR